MWCNGLAYGPFKAKTRVRFPVSENGPRSPVVRTPDFDLFCKGGYLVTRVRISAGPHVFLLLCKYKKRYGYVLHTDSAECAISEDVRVVKESGLRSAGAIRVGSNPTPRNFYDSYEGS